MATGVPIHSRHLGSQAQLWQVKTPNLSQVLQGCSNCQSLVGKCHRLLVEVLSLQRASVDGPGDHSTSEGMRLGSSVFCLFNHEAPTSHTLLGGLERGCSSWGHAQKPYSPMQRRWIASTSVSFRQAGRESVSMLKKARSGCPSRKLWDIPRRLGPPSDRHLRTAWRRT